MTKLKRRLACLRLGLVVLFCVLAVWLASLTQDTKMVETAAQQSSYTCLAGTAAGTIYDRNGEPLINQSSTCIAVVSPTSEAVAVLLAHVLDLDTFLENVAQGVPFVCAVDTMDIDCPDVTVLAIPKRYATHQLAQHLVGYTMEGSGVTGLEYAYDSILRSEISQWRVTYAVDGTSNVLAGETVQVRYGANPCYGVMTTLDATIQRLCETAGKSLEKGCVVVADVGSGDILGLASFPSYSVENLEEALNDTDSPLINRALYAYPVGSIFKLVTAACAKESGIAYSFSYTCTGEISIGSQLFHCHNFNGHGTQHMLDAMRNSCNPYFIALSEILSGSELLEMAQSLGFGTEIALAAGITASSGTLPTLEQLEIPAERANFCFGQGVLTATPLQITRMTCAIAGDGSLPNLRLVRGVTTDGKDVLEEEETVFESGISSETAAFLRSLMCYTAAAEDFQGCPSYCSMGAKTSTAQTGRYDANGEEYCDGWVTAFLPAAEPQYVVTVLAEDGGYGNDTVSPVLREIASGLMAISS